MHVDHVVALALAAGAAGFLVSRGWLARRTHATTSGDAAARMVERFAKLRFTARAEPDPARDSGYIVTVERGGRYERIYLAFGKPHVVAHHDGGCTFVRSEAEARAAAIARLCL